MHRELYEWFEAGTLSDYWGVPRPGPDQRVAADDWMQAAILTLHRMRPTYWEELQLPGDHFAGQRVLEVGCGPLVPLLQFSDCDRHAVDPLVTLYIEAGFPLDSFDASIRNAYGEQLPYPDASFDSVISVNALDHVDDFEQTAAEMVRVLKRGGDLYVEVEYHAPTTTEPVVLTDERMRAAFRSCEMTPVLSRTGAEMFTAMVNRFGVRRTARTNAVFGDARFVTWHGRRLR